MSETASQQPAAVRSGFSLRNSLPFIGLFGLFVLLGWPTLSDLADLYQVDPDFSHGLLIVPIALYLVYLRRDRFDLAKNVCSRVDRILGPVLIAVSTAIVVFSQFHDLIIPPITVRYLDISGIGLILCLAGLTWTMWGWKNCKLMLFPIAYLVFMLPLPERIVVQATLPLQKISSILAAGSLDLACVPVLREGNVLELETGRLEVVAACSGIRSLWCLMAIAVALADIKRLRFWRGILLVATVPVLGMIGNLLRLFVTGMLVAHGHKELSEGIYHEALGVMTILVPGAAIFGLASLLARRRKSVEYEGNAEERTSNPEVSAAQVGCCVPTAPLVQVPGETPARPATTNNSTSDHQLTTHFSLLPALLAGMMLLIGAGIVSVARHHYLSIYRSQQVNSDAPTMRKQLADFPVSIGRFSSSQSRALSEADSKVLLMSDYVIRTYTRPGEPSVGLTLMYWNPRKIGGSRWGSAGPHTADVCYPGAGWRRLIEDDDILSLDGLEGSKIFVRFFQMKDRERVIVYWNSITDRKATLGNPDEKHSDSSWWPTPANIALQYQYSVKIEVDVHGDDVETARMTARETALQFARDIAPILWEWGIGERNIARETMDPGRSEADQTPEIGDSIEH